MSLAGAWKQLWWSSDCRQGPEDCSRRTAQQWQKPGGGCTCWVGDVIRAVDFAQPNGDVSRSTVGRSNRSYLKVVCGVTIWCQPLWMHSVVCRMLAANLSLLCAWSCYIAEYFSDFFLLHLICETFFSLVLALPHWASVEAYVHLSPNSTWPVASRHDTHDTWVLRASSNARSRSASAALTH